MIHQTRSAPKNRITQAQAQAIVDDLQTALSYLQSAFQACKDLKLGNTHPDTYGDIAEIIMYCEIASDSLNEIEDEDA